MKKRIAVLSLTLMMLLGACSQKDGSDASAESSVPGPEVSQSTEQPEEPAESSGEPSEESQSESGAEAANQQNDGANAPAISASSLYATEPGQFSAMGIWGEGGNDHRLDLNVEQAQQFLEGISFSGFTYTEQRYELDYEAPHIIVMHDDLRPRLQMDKNSDVAELETSSGEKQYFIIPDGMYESISQRVNEYYKLYDADYVAGGETDAQGNLNAVTGDVGAEGQ